MENCLLLQKNSRIFLLVDYVDRFHIITVDNNLDDVKEEKVLTGTCSEAVMDEMGLTRRTIMKTDLRGVAIGGCCAGDIIVLYTKGEKLRYTLSDDYDDSDLQALFSGINRFQPPKNIGSKSRKTDWRIDMQVAPMRKIMSIIGSILNIIGFVCFFGSWFGSWPVINLSILAISIGLYFFYPQYFSLMGSKEYARVGYKAKVRHLDFAILGPGLGLVYRSIATFYFPNWTSLLLAGAIIGIVMAIIMRVFSREIKENASFFVAVLILAVLISCGIAGQINHLANTHIDESQTYEVTQIDSDKSRKGPDHYSCTVVIEPGVEMEIPITYSSYKNLLIGDMVTVYIGRGALGIEYACLVTPE